MESTQTITSIVPTHLPYVVSLVKFYETDSAIYLLLQHAAGGRLWSYVGSYLNQCPETPQAAPGVDFETFGCSPVEYSEGIVERSVENDTASLNCSHSVLQPNESDLLSSVHESELLSRLSTSELDCTNRIQDRELGADMNLLPDSFSPNPDVSSTGFNNILMSAATEMNCFSIGSFDSASASRQTSCSSEMNPNDSTNCIVSPPPSRETSVPRDITLTNVANGTNSTCLLDEEMSIYDRYRPCDVVSWDNFSDPEPLPSSSHEKRADDEDSLDKSNEKFSSSPVVFPTQSQDIESTDSSGRRPTILRISSHDRSFESVGRKRLRTLSLTFCELDLRGAGGTTTANEDHKCSNVTRLPESCVRQWAAEMVVAISRLHSTGIICRSVCL